MKPAYVALALLLVAMAAAPGFAEYRPMLSSLYSRFQGNAESE